MWTYDMKSYKVVPLSSVHHVHVAQHYVLDYEQFTSMI